MSFPGVFLSLYGMELILYFYFFMGIPQIVVLTATSSTTFLEGSLVLLLVSFQSSLISTLLESCYPIRKSKTEREVLQHPRKYIAPFLALIEIMVFAFSFNILGIKTGLFVRLSVYLQLARAALSALSKWRSIKYKSLC